MNPKPLLDVAKVLVTLCIGVCAASAAENADVDRAVTLEAIHDLENPRNVTRRGPRGELGPFQFRERTWRAYTDEPFARAIDPELAAVIAVRHYESIKAQLRAAAIPVSTYTIALAWNGGVGAVLTGRAPRRAHAYAQRALNLAEDFRRQRRRDATAVAVAASVSLPPRVE